MTRQPASASSPTPGESIDELTRIRGIGPVIKTRLHGAGIFTFAGLAALSAESIASLLPHVSAKQITEQGWIQQARKLVLNQAKARTRPTEPAISTRRQHYDNFTIEFLLDEKNKTRRVRVVHVQSGDVDTCAKWDAERLFDFLARHTGTRLSYAKSDTLSRARSISNPSISTEKSYDLNTATGSEPPVDKSKENCDLTPTLKIPETSDHLLLGFPPPLRTLPPAPARPSARIHLFEWKTLIANTNQELQNIPHEQAFQVNLSLDLTNAALSDISQLEFTAALYAKKLGNGHPQLIGETQTSMPSADMVVLTIGPTNLSQGLYRLEVLLTLIPRDSFLIARSGMSNSFQSGLFQVY
jgi:hypothetical protein